MPKSKYRTTEYAIKAEEKYNEKTVRASIFLNSKQTEEALEKYGTKENIKKAIKEIFLADLYQK